MAIYTMEQYNALAAAIAQGALRVLYGSGDSRKEVEYRSLHDMKELLADMAADLGINTGNTFEPKRGVFRFVNRL